MYFSDIPIYSKDIEKTTLLESMKLIGPLGMVATGQILKFLDYKSVMVTMRYLNKGFLKLTTSNLNFIPCNKTAIMKVSLVEVYKGRSGMKLNHL